jgi:uncharacterized protein (TIGR02646 family)
MKPIAKGGNSGNHALRTAHTVPPGTVADATSRWHCLNHKTDLRNNYLLPEQYHLCCYSELDADREGLGFHIEHIENKSQNPPRTFDYANLAASAFSSDEGLPLAKAQGWEVFGGHTAGKQGKPDPVDMALFVSPLRPDCARFFAYLSSGEVEPRNELAGTPDWERADYTIRLLNLNSPYLVSLRREWWDELDQFFQEHRVKGWSLSHLAQIDLLPRGHRMSRFFSLTRIFYGSLADQVLRTYLPSLA